MLLLKLIVVKIFVLNIFFGFDIFIFADVLFNTFRLTLVLLGPSNQLDILNTYSLPVTVCIFYYYQLGQYLCIDDLSFSGWGFDYRVSSGQPSLERGISFRLSSTGPVSLFAFWPFACSRVSVPLETAGSSIAGRSFPHRQVF